MPIYIGYILLSLFLIMKMLQGNHVCYFVLNMFHAKMWTPNTVKTLSEASGAKSKKIVFRDGWN